MNLPATRNAMHTGNLTFNDGHLCEMNLVADVMVSYKPQLATCMDNYKVLLYSGQLDLIVAAALTEAFVTLILWTYGVSIRPTQSCSFFVAGTFPRSPGLLPCGVGELLRLLMEQ